MLRARAEEMVGSARQGMRELERCASIGVHVCVLEYDSAILAFNNFGRGREVEELQQKVDDTTKEAERAMEERDNNNAEFIKLVSTSIGSSAYVDEKCSTTDSKNETSYKSHLAGACAYRYKTRSHMMLKKKEEELRRSMESAPQAEGALREALSQVCGTHACQPCCSICRTAGQRNFLSKSISKVSCTFAE